MTKLFFIGSLVVILGVATIELSDRMYTIWRGLINAKELEISVREDNVDYRIKVLGDRLKHGSVGAMALNQLGVDIFRLKIDRFKSDREVHAYVKSSWLYTLLTWVAYMGVCFGFSLAIISVLYTKYTI